jgi:hypothetical protein
LELVVALDWLVLVALAEAQLSLQLALLEAVELERLLRLASQVQLVLAELQAQHYLVLDP